MIPVGLFALQITLLLWGLFLSVRELLCIPEGSHGQAPGVWNRGPQWWAHDPNQQRGLARGLDYLHQ